MQSNRLDVKMARLETRMDEVVIPSLARIEKGVTNLKKEAFKKILSRTGHVSLSTGSWLKPPDKRGPSGEVRSPSGETRGLSGELP